MKTQTQSQVYTQLMYPYYCLSTSYMLSDALWSKKIAKLDILQQYKCIVLRLLNTPQEARNFFSVPGPREHTTITYIQTWEWVVIFGNKPKHV